MNQIFDVKIRQRKFLLDVNKYARHHGIFLVTENMLNRKIFYAVEKLTTNSDSDSNVECKI